MSANANDTQANIEAEIKQCLQTTLQQEFGLAWSQAAHIEPCKHAAEGEFTTNIAFILAKSLKQPPLTIAETLTSKCILPASIASMHAARPGFINVRISNAYMRQVLQQIRTEKSRFGAIAHDSRERILLEFVSVNPTGPLHIGHARGAAFGDSLARLLRFAGRHVTTEYYVNDAGRQINILVLSVYLRTLDERATHFPAHAYQGNYIKTMATDFVAQFGDAISSLTPPTQLQDQHTMAEEEVVDTLIAWLAESLPTDQLHAMRRWVVQVILRDIADDLTRFGVRFDDWFYESSVYQSGALTHVLQELQQQDACIEQEGALWLKTCDYGDDKNRVVQRNNGEFTYFATDIAYHTNKLKRGFHRLINVWGADHHGYVARLKAALQALGYQKEQLECILMQLVSLLQSGQKASMSTRSGQFFALADLIDAIGVDACRFHLVRHSAHQAMDLDVDLAVTKSRENPVFYVQYAHARICALANKMGDITPDYHEYTLTTTIEKRLVAHLGYWPTLLAAAADSEQPHMIVQYLEGLAERFHSFYAECKIQDEERSVQQGRYALCLAVKEVLVIGLELIGVSAPEQM